MLIQETQFLCEEIKDEVVAEFNAVNTRGSLLAHIGDL